MTMHAASICLRAAAFKGWDGHNRGPHQPTTLPPTTLVLINPGPRQPWPSSTHNPGPRQPTTLALINPGPHQPWSSSTLALINPQPWSSSTHRRGPHQPWSPSTLALINPGPCAPAGRQVYQPSVTCTMQFNYTQLPAGYALAYLEVGQGAES